jgi:hypothetical protein
MSSPSLPACLKTKPSKPPGHSPSAS